MNHQAKRVNRHNVPSLSVGAILATLATKSMKMDGKIFHKKTLTLLGRELNRVNFFGFDINHPVADATNQVMMTRHLAIKADCRSRMMQASQNAQLAERLQDAVNGGSRQPGDTRLDRFENLIHRRMIISFKHCAQHITTLNRHRHPACATQGLEVLQPSFSFRLVHGRVPFSRGDCWIAASRW